MVENQRPAVVLVSRCFVLRQNEILAIQRCATDRHNAGQWEAPGGKLDEGQDLHGALEREVEEEAGLLVKPIDTLAHFESHLLTEGPYAGMPYVVLFGLAEILEGEFRLSDEHDDGKWCSYAELLGLRLTQETRNAAVALYERLTSNGIR